jgi:hemoglobin
MEQRSAVVIQTFHVPPSDIRDRADVDRFVREFYRDAAMDDLLGPVFVSARTHWGEHNATLVDFWSWQLLGERGYVGRPIRAHEPAHARTPFTTAHFERWLHLFVGTIDSLFAGPVAELAKTRARKMAAAMQRLLGNVSDRGDSEIVVTLVASCPAHAGATSNRPQVAMRSQSAREVA